MNLSVYVSDCFMDSVIRAIETGEKSDEMQIFMNIVDSMWYCGEPGILFLDRINEGNPLPDCKYEGMAPCAELAMNGGERCHFAYINVARFVKDGQVCFQDLINTVRLITTALDNLIDVSIAADYNPVVANKRRISIGICGLAELFIMLRVPYGSEESLDITNEVMSVINYYSKATSMNLASLRGSFPWLDKSRLLDHEWFMSHGKGVSRHISNEMWESLWEQILENGIRNCATTALPPTGNSAYINHTTYSVEPIFHYNYEFVENTVKELSYKTGVPVKDSIAETIEQLPNEYRCLFLTAKELATDKHLALLEILQNNIDESISKTVNVPSNCTVEELLTLICRAYKMRLKGITIFRDNCLYERKGFADNSLQRGDENGAQ